MRINGIVEDYTYLIRNDIRNNKEIILVFDIAVFTGPRFASLEIINKQIYIWITHC